jgi:hypothetical protein
VTFEIGDPVWFVSWAVSDLDSPVRKYREARVVSLPTNSGPVPGRYVLQLENDTLYVNAVPDRVRYRYEPGAAALLTIPVPAIGVRAEVEVLRSFENSVGERCAVIVYRHDPVQAQHTVQESALAPQRSVLTDYARRMRARRAGAIV